MLDLILEILYTAICGHLDSTHSQGRTRAIDNPDDILKLLQELGKVGLVLCLCFAVIVAIISFVDRHKPDD